MLVTPSFVAASTVLFLIEQDEGHHKFGQAGSFHCPWVPALPLGSILVNVYLLMNVGLPTWLRVSVWLLLGGCGVYGLWNEPQPTCNGIAQGGPNHHEFQATARHTSVSASKLLQ